MRKLEIFDFRYDSHGDLRRINKEDFLRLTEAGEQVMEGQGVLNLTSFGDNVVVTFEKETAVKLLGSLQRLGIDVQGYCSLKSWIGFYKNDDNFNLLAMNKNDNTCVQGKFSEESRQQLITWLTEFTST